MPVSVPYRRQEGEDFCGPACLQMVIESIGLKGGSQPKLFADAHGHGTRDPKRWWASPPDGLEWTLGDRAGQSLPGGPQIVSFKTEWPLIRRLIWSLFHHDVPPIALVYGWDHWVVVVGYDIDRNPNGPSDGGYDVRALDIHDPWRTVEEGHPPPPPPPRHVTIREWTRTYLKPVPKGYWKTKVVAVGVFDP